MFESLRTTAANLEIGNLFVFSQEEKEIFGMRTLVPWFGETSGLWYVDLQTGKLGRVLVTCEVEKLDSFIDLIVRMYSPEMTRIETTEDAFSFLGVNPNPWED